MKDGFLRHLGVYGYDQVEPVILASLVSEDPLLLVGKAGTGKTFLLNSLSEALGLEHRHYNASLIAFDDLVGFPWPEKNGEQIRYIETPATVWKAESVLIDELNRCKPEHQNRLFSLVHERRIQGLRLGQLRYRWAAMNPPGLDQVSGDESYSGCEPLDSALADRFSFIVKVADWLELSEGDREAVADPRGEGAVSKDGGQLSAFVKKAREKFFQSLHNPVRISTEYATRVATALNQSGVRISPRRVRQLSRNLLALEAVCQWPRERLYRLGLGWSLPQRAGNSCPEETVISAAHRIAWEAVSSTGEEKWLHEFHLIGAVEDKISFLLGKCHNPDTGSIAVGQFLAVSGAVDRAIFALSLFPALVDNPGQVVGDEGVHDLGAVAAEILEIDSSVVWRDGSKRPYHQPGGGKYDGKHKDWTPCEAVIATLTGKRKQRAKHLLLYLLSKGSVPDNVREVEEKFHQSILLVKKYHATLHP